MIGSKYGLFFVIQSLLLLDIHAVPEEPMQPKERPGYADYKTQGKYRFILRV